MDWEQRSLRLCAAVLTLALLLRLCAGGLPGVLGQALEDPQVASFLVYLHTGRSVRLPARLPNALSAPAEDAVNPPTVPADEAPAFAADEADLVEITDSADLQPDIPSLLTRELSWDLTEGGPKVLILHTHTTESYTQSDERYEETSAYRTLDPGHNMLYLGDLVEERLEAAGIGVLHDETFHDYPSYNGAYTHAAESIAAMLEAYPSIELVLDLHRDAADTPYGQLATSCEIEGETAAQLMFVVAAAPNYSVRPDWQENLSLALKLQALLQREYPGICRSIHLSTQRYNQQLGPHALLVEIGAAGNTREEAAIAAEKLADAIIQLARGCGAAS